MDVVSFIASARCHRIGALIWRRSSGKCFSQASSLRVRSKNPIKRNGVWGTPRLYVPTICLDVSTICLDATTNCLGVTIMVPTEFVDVTRKKRRRSG